MRQPSADSTMK